MPSVKNFFKTTAWLSAFKAERTPCFWIMARGEFVCYFGTKEENHETKNRGNTLLLVMGLTEADDGDAQNHFSPAIVTTSTV